MLSIKKSWGYIPSNPPLFRRAQIEDVSTTLIMANEPIFQGGTFAINDHFTRSYKKLIPKFSQKNEPITNPLRTQNEPKTNPLRTQNEPISTTFS